jgi:type II secretion system protein H
MTSQISNNNSTSRGSKRSRCGFTLIELLLVMVLMAISIATILPQLAGRLGARKTRQTALTMAAAVTMAHQLALTTGQIVVFGFDPNNRTYSLRTMNDPAGLIDTTQTDSVLPPQAFDNDIEVASMEGLQKLGDESCAIFWPDGRTQEASVTLAEARDNAAAHWNILIDAAGSVTLKQAYEDE